MILYSLLVLIETKKDIQKLIKNSISFKLKFTIPILTAIYSIHWSSLSKKIIRYFNSNIPPILVAGRHFKILGADNPRSIPLYVIKNPLRIINPLRYAFFDKFIYMMCLTVPNLAFSIMSPSTLLPTIPWFAISLLSNYSPYFLIGYQYPSYVLPFILFSTIKGLKKMRTNKITKYLFLAPEKLMMLYLCINLCYFAIASPLSPCTKANTQNPAYKKPDENSHVTSIRETLDHIPKSASILTQDNIFPHVSSRKNSYVVPPIINGEYNEWKKSLNSIMNEAPEYILIDPSTDSHEILDPLLDEIDNYSIVESADNVFLYKLDDDENGIINAPSVSLGMISIWK
jgi:uncharacterized membrane protein